MQQVKLFTGLEGATDELSGEINSWIRESGATVLQISGNISPQSPSGSGLGAGLSRTGSSGGRVSSDVFVIVLYEEK
jgi:hypothetical protein